MTEPDTTSTFKKRVEIRVNPDTNEWTFKVYEGEKVTEYQNPKFIAKSTNSYTEAWNTHTRKHKYWEGYPDFLKADKSNKQTIITDPNKPLPEGTPFAKAINNAKQNLVTIGQTSGCLSSHAYSWMIPFEFSVG